MTLTKLNNGRELEKVGT